MGDIKGIVEAQRKYFAERKTLDTGFRKKQLRAFRQAVKDFEKDLLTAMKQDLGRCAFESWAGELGPVTSEIEHAIKHLDSWSKPARVPTPLLLWPGASQIRQFPHGVSLIIGPWNYPFHLLAIPLASALAAGNCSVLKPSGLSPATSRVIAKLVSQAFDPGLVAVVESGPEVSQTLLKERWDFIMFTGGLATGRKVLEAAAPNLTPVLLELGGKCPVIVAGDADIETAGRRIAWGKSFNAGQTCVAPDYVLVNRRVKTGLVDAIRKSIKNFYGENPATSPDYARIVNSRHFSRLNGLLKEGQILAGGRTDEKTLYIEPTIIGNASPESPLMTDEIFGPILPLLEYESLDEALAIIASLPAPLAIYLFSQSRKTAEIVIRATSSGSVAVNDTIAQVASPHLPFGGTGTSGFGRYHGRAGFDAFSVRRSVLKRSLHPDFKFRYPPYKFPLSLLKKLF